ncbi:MAG TPA: hypothetical protein PK507_01095 [bacterium]|nr:hypothetical protein [bacterium]
MNGKIYSLLKQIDSFIPEKFGLNKENRIFLKKLLNDEDFLEEQIKKNGGEDKFISKLENILGSLKNIKDKKFVNKYLKDDAIQKEFEKDKLIDKIVLDEYRKKENEKNNKEAIDNILNKINKKSE